MSSPAPSPRESLASTDLHRVDQAAWILAYKDPAPDPDAMLVVAAGVAPAPDRGGRSDVVITLISAMIERPPVASATRGQAREDSAARRLAAVLQVLAGTPEAALIQQAVRRGGLEGPLSLPAARRIRRAVKRAIREPPLADADVEPLCGLASSTWESLLDALARSLALDGDEEILTDVALDAPTGERPGARLARVRALLRKPPEDPRATDDASGVAPREQPTLGRKVGRFVLLQRIGSGAMGVVYAAYDDQLDRKIAIKVLRPQSPRDSARAQLRLFREAQAMARLSHPNVAVVHEVGTDGADVYVAMEFIRGSTVQTWLTSKPRTWRDIVDVFLQAGRGLAAAHAAGLVHRDFKPSNVMIGADERVRVLDFGLCSTGQDTTSGEHDGPRLRELSGELPLVPPKVTQGGEVVGTPAYMPPEQFSGRVVGPVSDQFAFCVSLYEALYGQLPFPGETIHELAHAVARGEVRDPPRGTRVPTWLHATILRGLRPDPKDRYASMDALLRALDRSHVLRRRTYAFGLALVGAAAVGGFVAAKAQQTEQDPCQNGAGIVETAWNAERRAAAERAIVAAGPAFAAEVWPRVDAELGQYTESWVTQYTDACEAHRRGEQSDQMLDRRMSCLRQRKTALAEAATLLAERDVTIALRALEMVGGLPDIERCGDMAVLLAEVPPPSDPEVARKVNALREALVRVEALERAGRQNNAIDLADQLVREAEAIGHRPALAQALLIRGRLSVNLTVNPATDAKLLQRALVEAVAAREDEVAAEAMARLVFVRGRSPGELPRALDDIPLAEALVARLPAPDRVRGLLLNNAGVVYVSGGDAVRARELLGQALQVKRAAYGPRDVEVGYTLTNLAMLAEKPEERADGLRQVLDIFEAGFGAAHPQTIEARITASLYTRDPEVARTLLRPGCDALARFTAGDVVQRARCLQYFAHHSAEAGADESARLAIKQAADLLASNSDARVSVIDKTLIRGYAALDAGEHEAAVTELQETLKETAGDEWWRRRERAELGLVIGLHRRQLGDLAGAREALQVAVEGFEAVVPFARDILLVQRMARARVALAAVLLATPAPSAADLARAESLIAEADRWYRGGGEAYAWRLSELRGLRDALERLRDRTR
jgi:tRNA A-37 threonylcarbamoyl transferase component Bud32/tetratricopeptide (TPR) repeat protein